MAAKAASASAPFQSVDFRISVEGTLNKTPLKVTGQGTVPHFGVYTADLEFSAVPPDFHPSAASIILVSICCYNAAAMRNGGLNIHSMGATGYQSRRIAAFPDGEIVVEGQVESQKELVTFDGRIDGNVKLPDTLVGNSMYVVKIDPREKGRKLTSIGEGSLFTQEGEEIPLGFQAIHVLRGADLARRLSSPQFRLVTESGSLRDRTYTTTVHSFLDGTNSMQRVEASRFSSDRFEDF